MIRRLFPWSGATIVAGLLLLELASCLPPGSPASPSPPASRMAAASEPLTFVSPTPETTPGAAIIEVTPLGEFPAGLGTLRYSVLTNLRNCSGHLAWPSDFDPAASCGLIRRDDGQLEQIPPGAVTWVWSWRRDGAGNVWAWFGSLAAAACWKGVPRGEFYPGAPTWQVAAGSALPQPRDPCQTP